MITFHYGQNFGGVLQALALQLSMTELGATATVIDYVPNSDAPPKWWQGWNLRGKPSRAAMRNRLIRWRHEEAARARFEAFRSVHMTRSSRAQDLEECQALFNEYDLLVAGSDQIWNFDRNNCYFLSTTIGFNGRKISYASSCGSPAQSQARRPEIRALLRPFSHISVRDEFTADLLEEVTGERPLTVADPTLLVDQSALQTSISLPYTHYVLCYFLGNEIVGGHDEMLRQIRNRVGDLPVVVVMAALNPQPTPYADHVVYDADPGQWLWLVQQAEFVYTDSYHGLLFALRSGRPALAYYAEALRAPRLVDLAERYELQRHVVPGVGAAASAIGWEFPASRDSLNRIEEHASFSRAYLKNAINQ